MDEPCEHVFCNFGSLDDAKKALETGQLARGLLSQYDDYMDTPLHCACFYGRVEVVAFLCDNLDHEGITLPNGIGITPLHMACGTRDKPLKPLIDYLKYEDLIKNDGHGQTPFYRACFSGNIKAVKELTRRLKPKDMETPNKYGVPPLRIAHAADRSEVLEWLMTHTSPDYVTTELKKDPGDYNDPFFSQLWEFVGNQRQTTSQIGRQYLLDPTGARLACRKQFGLHYEDAAGLFALIVGLCDGYFTLNLGNHLIPTIIRFLNIMIKLPMELQMVVSNRCFDSERDVIKKSDLDDAISNIY